MHRRDVVVMGGAFTLVAAATAAPAATPWPHLEAAARLNAWPRGGDAGVVVRALGPTAMWRLCARQEARLAASRDVPDATALRRAIAADFRAGDHVDIAGVRCAALEAALVAVTDALA